MLFGKVPAATHNSRYHRSFDGDQVKQTIRYSDDVEVWIVWRDETPTKAFDAAKPHRALSVRVVYHGTTHSDFSVLESWTAPNGGDVARYISDAGQYARGVIRGMALASAKGVTA